LRSFELTYGRLQVHVLHGGPLERGADAVAPLAQRRHELPRGGHCVVDASHFVICQRQESAKTPPEVARWALALTRTPGLNRGFHRAFVAPGSYYPHPVLELRYARLALLAPVLRHLKPTL